MTKRSLRNLIVSALAVAGLGLATIAPAAVAAQPEFATYIVTVAKGSEQSVQARAKALGGEIGFVYTTALNGFSVRMPAAAANGLQRAPGVEAMELDGVASIDTDQTPTPSWGLDRIDQRDKISGTTSSYGYVSDGSSVPVYIIDTGMRLTHKEFTGRVDTAKDRDFVSNDNDASDCNGHGTHVAGTVGGTQYGVAKKVTFIAVRVLNCAGSGQWSGVVAGIDYVAAEAGAKGGSPSKAVAVANMSLGGGISSSVDAAVQGAIDKGVVMVVAAGNSSADACQSSPARAPGAITVAASDRSDALASYSNRGACVDVIAPGSSITSAWNTSDTKSNTISGTSMASPHVAGVAARLLGASLTDQSVAQIAAAIRSAASSGKVSGVPSGTANLLLYANPNG